MINKVDLTIERYGMLDGVKEVTVALSGGADSVALLLVMLELKAKYGFSLYAAHLNHMLRNDESDRDERFVRKLCDELDIELFCESIDIKTAAAKNHESIELAARHLRYDFLNRVSHGIIATAHTANDNIETVLYNMARGTGISGMCGIPPVRDNIIRPLILVTREQIEKFLHDKNYEFCVDSTNNNQTYKRNRIRHSVVPALRNVNSSVIMNTALMSERLREDASFLKITAEEAFEECFSQDGLDVEKLMLLHTAIRNRLITMLYEIKVSEHFEHVYLDACNELLKIGKGRRSVGCDYSAVLQNGILRFVYKQDKKELIVEKTVSNYPCVVNGVKITIESLEEIKNTNRINNLLLKNAADCDKINGEIIIRGRKTGDFIKIKGRGVTKSLKKLFNENKIDSSLRDSLPIAADQSGVIWLADFGVDERVAVTNSTKNVLLFDFPHIKG